MAAELIIEPDVERHLVTILTGDSHIQAFAPVTVSSSYQGYTNSLTWVHLYRGPSGATDWPMPINAIMHFDIVAATREICNPLARTVRGVIHAHRGDTVGIPGNGMCITNIVDVSGVQWLPDTAGLPRYIFSVQVSARPI